MNTVIKEFKNNKEAQRYFDYKRCDSIFYGSKKGTIKNIGFVSITVNNNKIILKSEYENTDKLNEIFEN